MSKQESQIYKGIAIILMLFHHLFNDFEEYAGYTVNYWPFTAQKVQLFAVLSKICVAVFVFITGYGLAASFQKECAPALASSDGASRKKNCLFSFTWKRWWRLMTNYWFIFVLVLLLQPLGRTIFDAYGTGTKQIAVSGIIDFLGLADLFHTDPESHLVVCKPGCHPAGHDSPASLPGKKNRNVSGHSFLLSAAGHDASADLLFFLSFQPFGRHICL